MSSLQQQLGRLKKTITQKQEQQTAAVSLFKEIVGELYPAQDMSGFLKTIYVKQAVLYVETSSKLLAQDLSLYRVTIVNAINKQKQVIKDLVVR